MKLQLLALGLLGLASAPRAEFRFFLAYGDEALAELQRRDFGGISNPGAVVGAEIPSNVPLKVRKAADNRTFSLAIMVVRTSGDEHRLYSGGSVLVTYDRAPAGSLDPHQFLDKKLQFGGVSIPGSFQNFGSFRAFQTDGNFLDDDGDGNPDVNSISTLNRSLRAQYSVAALPGRKVGLSCQFTMNPIGAKFKIGYTPERLFNIRLRSNLAALESYHGLGIHIYNGPDRPTGGTSTYLSQNNEIPLGNTFNNIGTNLTVQAVPESGTAAAILAGLAAFGLRRRK